MEVLDLVGAININVYLIKFMSDKDLLDSLVGLTVSRREPKGTKKQAQFIHHIVRKTQK